jgi:hypothetical protein
VNDELKRMCKEAFMGSFEVMSGIIRRKARKPHEISIGIAAVADGVRTGQFVDTGRMIHS